MWEWIKTAETAELIFYGLLIGLSLAEVLLRYILRVSKTNVVLEYVDSGFIAIILALIIRTLFFQAFKIPSGSMENTLLIGDHLLVNKFIYGTPVPFTDKRILKIRDPRRGDIIVFKFPENPRRDFIKRCVAVPGDVVEIKNKILHINGNPQNEGHVTFRDMRIFTQETSPRDNFGPITVPAGHFFMMGDNRDFSADSRFWGFLPLKLIKGKAWIIYWPITRWRQVK
ncbi:signal peptidase I [candidate division FCPU426 bacterium]|nr:signal peptidase I [candidate division FCPU426 bacterium]